MAPNKTATGGDFARVPSAIADTNARKSGLVRI